MSDSENIDNENLPHNEMDLKDEINRYINQNKEEVKQIYNKIFKLG